MSRRGPTRRGQTSRRAANGSSAGVLIFRQRQGLVATAPPAPFDADLRERVAPGRSAADKAARTPRPVDEAQLGGHRRAVRPENRWGCACRRRACRARKVLVPPNFTPEELRAAQNIAPEPRFPPCVGSS